MKLIVCCKDVDDSLSKGDLISWREDDAFEGKRVGLFNAVKYNEYTKEDYLERTPFIVLNIPSITYDDLKVMWEDVDLTPDENGDPKGTLLWKIDFEKLERRPVGSIYSQEETQPTKQRWNKVIDGDIRRDTLRAYREITRPDVVTIDQIKVAR